MPEIESKGSQQSLSIINHIKRSAGFVRSGCSTVSPEKNITQCVQEQGECAKYAEAAVPPSILTTATSQDMLEGSFAASAIEPLAASRTAPNCFQRPSDISRLRKGFQTRLLETPGVVGSTGDQVACSLLIEGHAYPIGPETDKNFKTLRTLWETPDGWAFSEAIDLWRHARELSLGFHYRWRDPPPPGWLEVRKAWAARVREILSRSRTLDTELQVVHAVDRGEADGAELLQAWRDVKDSFTPNTMAVWHDPEPMRWVVEWMKKPGIVWTEHTLFAEALSQATGRPYFGANGVDAKSGLPIEQGTGAIIASVAANSTGRNLQKWHRNLITSVPGNAPMWEQLLGRTHRDGQQADTVTVDMMIGCAEHLNGFHKARDAARAQLDLLGHTQKLLLADIVLPSPLKMVGGDRWIST